LDTKFKHTYLKHLVNYKVIMHLVYIKLTYH
jgi:hypothetical protein